MQIGLAIGAAVLLAAMPAYGDDICSVKVTGIANHVTVEHCHVTVNRAVTLSPEVRDAIEKALRERGNTTAIPDTKILAEVNALLERAVRLEQRVSADEAARKALTVKLTQVQAAQVKLQQEQQGDAAQRAALQNDLANVAANVSAQIVQLASDRQALRDLQSLFAESKDEWDARLRAWDAAESRRQEEQSRYDKRLKNLEEATQKLKELSAPWAQGSLGIRVAEVVSGRDARDTVRGLPVIGGYARFQLAKPGRKEGLVFPLALVGAGHIRKSTRLRVVASYPGRENVHEETLSQIEIAGAMGLQANASFSALRGGLVLFPIGLGAFWEDGSSSAIRYRFGGAFELGIRILPWDWRASAVVARPIGLEVSLESSCWYRPAAIEVSDFLFDIAGAPGSRTRDLPRGYCLIGGGLELSWAP